MTIPSLIFPRAPHKLAAAETKIETAVRIVRVTNCFSKTDSVAANDKDKE